MTRAQPQDRSQAGQAGRTRLAAGVLLASATICGGAAQAGTPEPHRPGDNRWFEEISDHVEHRFGPIVGILHPSEWQGLHVDVIVARVDSPRPGWVLVTGGMSDRDQPAPAPELVEFLVWLDADRYQPPALNEVRPEADDIAAALRWLPAYAHSEGALMSLGTTIEMAFGAPLLDGTEANLFLIAPPVLWPEAAWTVAGVGVELLQLVPIRPDELELKLEAGWAEPVSRLLPLDAFGPIDPARPSALQEARL